jgi:hypothetical protein
LTRFIPTIISRVAKGRDPLKSVKLSFLDVNAEDNVSLIRDSGLKVVRMAHCKILTGSCSTDEVAIRQVAQSLAMTSSLLDFSLELLDHNEPYFLRNSLRIAIECKHGNSVNGKADGICRGYSRFGAACHCRSASKVGWFDQRGVLLRLERRSVNDVAVNMRTSPMKKYTQP